MIEFALVLPAVLLLVIGGLDAVSTLRHSEITTTLSRELASQTFRECSSDASAFGVEKFDPNTCLQQQILPLFRSRFERLVPKAEFIVTIYSLVPATTTLRSASLSHVAPGSNFISAYPPSRVQSELTGASGPNTVGEVLKKFETTVVAEVAVPQPAYWKFIPKIMGGNPERIYATTVL